VTQICTGWYRASNLYENMTISVDGEGETGTSGYACPFFQAEEGFGYASSGGVTAASAVSLSPDGKVVGRVEYDS
jgi:hypothetical protein